MSSLNRRVKHSASVAQSKSQHPSPLPKKWLTVSATLTLIVALLFVWKFAPATAKPNDAIPVVTFASDTDDSVLSLPSSLPLSTDAENEILPIHVPARQGDANAAYRYVVDKKTEGGIVTLTLQDKKDGSMGKFVGSPVPVP